ncbi:GNAT family N-acetyltransferase [Paenibacillus sp. N1-5-1-14]|uniref:GNAT family N-acetyltransferase n=1 Tax=Paenibacillus radicibacter TaxID=2972488 RepID=UPI0021592845|nr:GNAT family N-acetyltransferase [Paenibacillus radicibacter]MCR8644411.1 GNAT family N-acetyltransferase [Paenibacillus radicibacter]
MYIETARLIIRPFQKEDYHNWYEQYKNRLPSQYAYDDGRSSNMEALTEEWFSNWVQGFENSANRDEMVNLGIFRKIDGVNVGKVEVHTILRMDYQWAMMGYSIHNQYWKNGYGLESVDAAVEAFFEHLKYHRIELHINVDNMPSILLAERAGFRLECVREKFTYENEKWNDMLIYYRSA